jgi:hypothetical protein
MKATSEAANNARSKVLVLIRQLLESHRAAETPQSQRDILLQLRAINETIALVEPATNFGQFTELQELEVSEIEMSKLLSGYHAKLCCPEEKIFLARIQNCVLRGQVLDRRHGAERVLRLMIDLQKDSNQKLVLM